MSDTCEKCEREIAGKIKYSPFEASERSGGCTKCKCAAVRYNESPCKECVEEETTIDKFPRFERAKIGSP